jgi:hypothetical protein
VDALATATGDASVGAVRTALALLRAEFMSAFSVGSPDDAARAALAAAMLA